MNIIDELRSDADSPFAKAKAERIRAIILKAEAAGIRAEPDIDDAYLIEHSDFRIVSVFTLARAISALAHQQAGSRSLQEVTSELLAAAEEYLLGGQHEGPCNMEGGACWDHVTTTQMRKERLAAIVAQLRGTPDGAEVDAEIAAEDAARTREER